MLAGPAMPVHEITSKPGATVSATVGTSGKSGQRVLPVTANARNSPDFTRELIGPVVAAMKSTSPVSTPVIAGASPRYGTCRNLVLVWLPSSSPVVCRIEPTPAEPYFNSLGLFLASSTSCLMVLKRESAFTAIMNG